jgi:hypothetical protein
VDYYAFKDEATYSIKMQVTTDAPDDCSVTGFSGLGFSLCICVFVCMCVFAVMDS